jgi:hypothetical protein
MTLSFPIVKQSNQIMARRPNLVHLNSLIKEVPRTGRMKTVEEEAAGVGIWRLCQCCQRHCVLLQQEEKCLNTTLDSF